MGIQWLSISVRNVCFELQNRNQKCHGGYWAQTSVIWPSQKHSPLTLFFCGPTSNTTMLFHFHHLLYAFEDPKWAFLTFPKLYLNPTGITFINSSGGCAMVIQKVIRQNPGLLVSLSSPYKAFPHFLRDELFFFFPEIFVEHHKEKRRMKAHNTHET